MTPNKSPSKLSFTSSNGSTKTTISISDPNGFRSLISVLKKGKALVENVRVEGVIKPQCESQCEPQCESQCEPQCEPQCELIPKPKIFGQEDLDKFSYLEIYDFHRLDAETTESVLKKFDSIFEYDEFDPVLFYGKGAGYMHLVIDCLRVIDCDKRNKIYLHMGSHLKIEEADFKEFLLRCTHTLGLRVHDEFFIPLLNNNPKLKDLFSRGFDSLKGENLKDVFNMVHTCGTAKLIRESGLLSQKINMKFFEDVLDCFDFNRLEQVIINCAHLIDVDLALKMVKLLIRTMRISRHLTGDNIKSLVQRLKPEVRIEVLMVHNDFA